MKTLITTLLVLFLSVPTAIAGDADGKGLVCVEKDFLPDMYFIFKDSKVIELHINREVPLKIFHGHPEWYRSYADTITWDGLWELDRKTLHLRHLTNTHIEYQCEVKTADEVMKTLNKKLEAMKESMKDNKI